MAVDDENGNAFGGLDKLTAGKVRTSAQSSSPTVPGVTVAEAVIEIEIIVVIGILATLRSHGGPSVSVEHEGDQTVGHAFLAETDYVFRGKPEHGPGPVDAAHDVFIRQARLDH